MVTGSVFSELGRGSVKKGIFGVREIRRGDEGLVRYAKSMSVAVTALVGSLESMEGTDTTNIEEMVVHEVNKSLAETEHHSYEQHEDVSELKDMLNALINSSD